MIRSVSSDQEQILLDILSLYVPSGTFDVDSTYSKGNFYRHKVPKPLFRSDIQPAVGLTAVAFAQQLPITPRSVFSIVFDPPFLHGTGTSSQMAERFGSFETPQAVLAFYHSCIVEFKRVLKAHGILVFKCQDTSVTSFTQSFNHVHIYNLAQQIGFEAIDLFLLISNHRIGTRAVNQTHARKFHSYFWVFRKIPLR